MRRRKGAGNRSSERSEKTQRWTLAFVGTVWVEEIQSTILFVELKRASATVRDRRIPFFGEAARKIGKFFSTFSVGGGRRLVQ